MKYTTFLEAVRGRPLKPQPEDPKAPTTPARQAIRDAGDVGKQELVGKVYPDMDTTDPSTYREYGKRLATAATGVQFGDQQDPVDRALDITRPEAIYSAQQKTERQNRFAELKRSMGARPGGTSANAKAKQAAYDAKVADAEAERDVTGTEVDDQGRTPLDRMSTGERMQRTMDALKPIGRADATREVDDALDDAQLAAELPRMREPLTITGPDGQEVEIADVAYKRHGYQQSGVDVPNPTEEPDEFIDNILSANFDKDKLAKGEEDAQGNPIPRTKMDPAYFADTSATGEGSMVRTPSERDLQTFQQSGEDLGDFTPEVLQHQAALRDATATQDSAAVQELAFKYSDEEITDEMIDRAIERFGFKSTGKSILADRVETFGISSSDRQRAAYGGLELFPEGKVPDKYKPKKMEGGKWVPDEDAPHGVYDFTTLPKQLKAKAIEARGRELIRTYLKQGGTDAYAPHEGQRSITDMDLEHIRSLKADLSDSADTDGDETNDFGYDQPSNWVFASGQLNKLRAANPLTKATDRFVNPAYPDDSVTSERLSASKQTLKDFIDSVLAQAEFKNKGEEKKARMELNSAIGDELGGTTKAALQSLSPEQRQEKIDSLVINFGMSLPQAQQVVADIGLSDENPATNRERNKRGEKIIGRRNFGQENRLDRRNYIASPEDYRQDLRTSERDDQVYNAGINALRKMYPSIRKEEDLLDQPAGLEFLQKLSRLTPSGMRDFSASAPAPVAVDDSDI